MSLPSLQRFSKAIAGNMLVAADINIFACDVTQKYPVGQGVLGAGGEVYRYSSFDATATQGQLVGPNLSNITKSITTTAPVTTTVTIQAEYPILPNTIGSHHIQLTLASVTVNQYQGGKIIIAAKSGSGYTYDIRFNTATGTLASGAIDIQTVQPLQANLSPNSSIIIAPSKYNDLVVAQSGAGNNYVVCGVVLGNPGGNSTSNNFFGFVQTKGEVGCVEDATVAIPSGAPITLSKVTAGAYSLYGNVTTTAGGGTQLFPAIGYSVLANGTSGGFGAINIDLE
jgi:hypothetical protein